MNSTTPSAKYCVQTIHNVLPTKAARKSQTQFSSHLPRDAFHKLKLSPGRHHPHQSPSTYPKFRNVTSPVARNIHIRGLLSTDFYEAPPTHPLRATPSKEGERSSFHRQHASVAPFASQSASVRKTAPWARKTREEIAIADCRARSTQFCCCFLLFVCCT